jgi:peroxiredoxin
MRICVLLFTVMLLAACSKDRIKISGNIINADKDTLYIDEVDVYESNTIDSTILTKKGKFSFTIKSNIPGFYQLKMSNGEIIVLFPKPGDHIKINADAGNLLPSLNIEGSHETEQLTKLIMQCNETKKQLDSINMQYKDTETDSIRSRLIGDYREIIKKQRQYSIAFLLTHYNSLASIYALYQQYQPGNYIFDKVTDIQFFKIITDSLTKYYPTSRHVISLKAHTDKLLSDYKKQLILQKAGDTESTIPDVKLPDYSGDTIALKSLANRYILLSFWMSTSEECVNQNLLLKNVYNKYRRTGFEIYQVSFDQSMEEWRQAVRYDELPWISVIDASYPASIVAGNYNVTQIPSNYLIDKNNLTILGKNLTPAQLEQKLKEIMN